MELFILLLLLSICCCCQAIPLQGLDCDDHEVFNAVDVALKGYNGGRRHGSIFALSRILEASRTAGLGKNFLVKYQVRETACAIGEGVPWQNCRFIVASEGDSGECTAEVHLDASLSLSSVQQTCKLKPAPGKVTISQSPCLGCWQPIDTKNLELQPVVSYGIELFNNRSNETALFDVGKILKGQRQVVAGWNYKAEYSIKKTNCSKDEFPNLTPACKIIPGDREGICKVTAYVHFTDKLVSATQTCKLQVNENVPPPKCVGCAVDISTYSPELQEPLAAALEKYNSESQDDFYYKIEEITKATVQVVSGMIYRIDFIIRETNCSKAEFPKLNETCTTREHSQPLNCVASIYEKLWESIISATVNCTKKEKVDRRLPGLTPFRNNPVPEIKKSHEDVQKQEIPNQPSTSKPFPHEGDEEFFGFLNPPLQGSPGSTISIFDPLPDLPEPLVPKCPGRPWKPVVVPVTPLQDDLNDFTLTDLLPLPDEEAHPPKTASNADQQNTGDFDLADALL